MSCCFPTIIEDGFSRQVLSAQSSLTRVHMMRLHGNPRTEATGAHTQDQAALERLMNLELVVKVLALSSWEKCASSPVGKFWPFLPGKSLGPLLWDDSGPFLLEKVWVLSCGKILVLSCGKSLDPLLRKKMWVRCLLLVCLSRSFMVLNPSVRGHSWTLQTKGFVCRKSPLPCRKYLAHFRNSLLWVEGNGLF